MLIKQKSFLLILTILIVLAPFQSIDAKTIGIDVNCTMNQVEPKKSPLIISRNW
jgi:hypothetical protein